MTEEEVEGAKNKWLEITRAHECLTDNVKYKNWLEYGNPEGSLLAKTIDLAMPSWVLKQENQLYVLGGFFAIFVIVPMLIISQVKDKDPEDVLNQIHEDTPSHMSATLFQILDKNVGKKVKQLSDDQWIEVFEQSVEFYTLNDRLAKKIILRDLIRKKINNQTIAEMFADAEWEVDDKLPKLTNSLAK